MKRIKSMSINGKAVAMCKMGGGIMFSKPNTYEILEYLESTGTQWIDTGISKTPATGFYLDYQMSYEKDKDFNEVIFGCQSSYVDNTFILYYYFLDHPHGAFRMAADKFADVNLGISQRGVLSFINNVFTDAQGNSATIENAGFIGTTIKLYGNTDNTGTTRWLARCKVYGFKLYEGAEVILDFHPCRRIADGELGMYDTVTKQFFTNQGSGTFVAGPATGKKY